MEVNPTASFLNGSSWQIWQPYIKQCQFTQGNAKLGTLGMGIPVIRVCAKFSQFVPLVPHAINPEHFTQIRP